MGGFAFAVLLMYFKYLILKVSHPDLKDYMNSAESAQKRVLL